MNTVLPIESLHNATEVLHSLMEVGSHLSSLPDRRKALDVILREARRLTSAEAGSLYVVKNERLQFVAAQNDRVPLPQITRVLLDKEIPVSTNSLVGYVASTGQVMNIPNADDIAPDSPFRINRSFDQETGYHVTSILALPLRCFEDHCIGVLELFNRLDPRGRVIPFPSSDHMGIISLATMASLTIHNMLLQEELKQSHLDTIIRLSVVVEFRDNSTAYHIRRMAEISAVLARAMGIEGREAELIECASPMHDVGKVGIPDAILQKPGRLTPGERRVIEQHPQIGAEILGEPRNDLIAAARVVSLSHHEKWDGTGYPNRLAGEQIPLSGRIVGLADVFDALASKRPYKDAMPIEQVLDIIRQERGKHFDPQVVDAFFTTVDPVLAVYAAQEAAPVSVGVGPEPSLQ